MYTFFEPVLPIDPVSARTKTPDGRKSPGEKKTSSKFPASRNGSKSSNSRPQRPLPNSEKKTTNLHYGNPRRSSPEKVSWNVLDLKEENYFSCSVGRPRSNARFILGSSDDVVLFMKQLANASFPTS